MSIFTDWKTDGRPNILARKTKDGHKPPPKAPNKRPDLAPRRINFYSLAHSNAKPE